MNYYSKQTQSNPTCSELVEPTSKGAPMLHILITSEQVITAVLQSRLALRYILRNPDIIPIPGLSHVQHVEIPL